MARDLPMFRVTPDVRRPGINVMAAPLLSDAEVEERVRTGAGLNHTPWPMDKRPGMLPGPDCLDVV